MHLQAHPGARPASETDPVMQSPSSSVASHLRVCSGPFQAVPAAAGSCASITRCWSGWGWQSPLGATWCQSLLKEGHPEPHGCWAPLERARLHLLCTLPSDSDLYGEGALGLLFCRLKSPISLSPFSPERCVVQMVGIRKFVKKKYHGPGLP